MVFRTLLAGTAWAIALWLASASAAVAQATDSTIEVRVAAAQARRGKAVFQDRCAACHTSKQFHTPSFVESWAGRPVFELFDEIRTSMPQNAPGQLSAEEYLEVVAYLLLLNGHAASEQPLPESGEGLRWLRFRGGDGS